MTNEEAANVLNLMASGIKLKGYTDQWMSDFKTAYAMAIKVLEERQQGEWELSSIQVVGENWYKCSICGRKIRTSTYHLKEYPFCHCGADMRGGAK